MKDNIYLLLILLTFNSIVLFIFNYIRKKRRYDFIKFVNRYNNHMVDGIGKMLVVDPTCLKEEEKNDN